MQHPTNTMMGTQKDQQFKHAFGFLAHPHQLLADHLTKVAALAERFGAAFGASEQCKLAGLLHDLGKATDSFRTRMEAIASGKADPGDKQPHAHHGAALALDQDYWPVAFAVNGHHAGLHNRGDLAKRLDYRQRAFECLDRLKHEGFADLPKCSILPKWLENLSDEPRRQLLSIELFTRFVFSALVDADRLDTESNDPSARAASQIRKEWRFNGEPIRHVAGSANRAARPFAPQQLIDQVDAYLAKKHRNPASLGQTEAAVQHVRSEVATCCRTGGDHLGNKARGLFSLTVPTGGGKTLASLLFALSHARAHSPDNSLSMSGLAPLPIRRIIVVIPFLSIIQQTAFELRKVFGDLVWQPGAVNPATGQASGHSVAGEEGAWLENSDPAHLPVILEHHSGAPDPALDDKRARNGDYSNSRTLRQLAAENWDAPVIVTTSVQFFDSLFSRSPADARKLHNIAQSVILFDEVQTLPPHLLQPILDVLGELTHPDRPYGCSAVFCTATQPALGQDPNNPEEFPFGLKNVQPIIPHANTRLHFEKLKRVEYVGINRDSEPEEFTPEQVAKLAAENEHHQCLVVVNTRKSARQVFAAVNACNEAAGVPNATFHLSTWMFPAHRLQVLEEVRWRLSAGQPCFLVSTQCIEAGVDVDFPEVWRAYGPYDSIVQAAGRCNREGRLKGLGKVHVFRLEGDNIDDRTDIYGVAAKQTSLLRKMDRAHPEDPTSFEDYFRLLYQISVPDECSVQQNRSELRFEEVSKLFNFIESHTTPLLIIDQVVDGQPCQTEAAAIYQAARKRPIPGGAGCGWFTRDDWRRLQPFILNLDFQNKATCQALANYARPVFGSDDIELRIWNAGNAGYTGGVNGTGINLDNLDEAIRDLLT